MRAATLAFAIVAALAVHCVIAPRGGNAAAAALAAATFAALALAALARERRQPVALCLEPDGIAALGRSGGLLLRGRIAGCAQWADRLLLIAVMPHGGTRAASFVVAADALPAEAFRELAVRARYAAR
ncbi:MAG: hypothetical protein QOI13_1459 [Paraburkholderia sp.]|nr:hypothetical protein [Paraburkholderia sp.]